MLRLLVENLRPQDRVSIVAHASMTEEVPNDFAALKEEIMSAINRLEAGGSTAGGKGIQHAYSIEKKTLSKAATTALFLPLTETSTLEFHQRRNLSGLFREMRNQGIYLSVLGFGSRQ
ncbi:MAG: VWA domain-containing protein [Planctomycetota bacterium]|nr:VWA domain-containing protein [Planctomycetota bacterium]